MNKDQQRTEAYIIYSTTPLGYAQVAKYVDVTLQSVMHWSERSGWKKEPGVPSYTEFQSALIKQIAMNALTKANIKTEGKPDSLNPVLSQYVLPPKRSEAAPYGAMGTAP